jgi:hypothetical protein
MTIRLLVTLLVAQLACFSSGCSKQPEPTERSYWHGRRPETANPSLIYDIQPQLREWCSYDETLKHTIMGQLVKACGSPDFTVQAAESWMTKFCPKDELREAIWIDCGVFGNYVRDRTSMEVTSRGSETPVKRARARSGCGS